MRKLFFAFALIAVPACTAEFRPGIDPYAGRQESIFIHTDLPGLAGPVTYTAKNLQSGASYLLATDSLGNACANLTAGLYSFSASTVVDDYLWQYGTDRIDVSATDTLVASFIRVEPGDLLIKELYTGGCKDSVMVYDSLKKEYVKTLQTDQVDKYFILHNNTADIIYLDSLCFGTLSPCNANGHNKFLHYDEAGLRYYDDFCPVYQAIWQIGGDGTTFPLAPGADAVVCIFAAIDHSEKFPSSVNLNKAEHFVCYDKVNFHNTTYHPTPGDQIDTARILDVVIKTGSANAYTFSISSPTLIIFKAVGCTIQEFVGAEGNVIQEPGSTYDKVVKIPYTWVLDALEVFNGSVSNNVKRLRPELDAGFVYQSATYLGHSLLRKVNQSKTNTLGREVLVDTNNSTNDFEEVEHPSLWYEKK